MSLKGKILIISVILVLIFVFIGSRLYRYNNVSADRDQEKSTVIYRNNGVYVEFDGERYRCSNDKKTYKYLLELRGHLKNAACDTAYVILADEKYTFDDISKSLYSSDSNDQIPYNLVSCETFS